MAEEENKKEVRPTGNVRNVPHPQGASESTVEKMKRIEAELQKDKKKRGR